MFDRKDLMTDKKKKSYWKAGALVWLLSILLFVILYYGFDAHFRGETSSPLGYVTGFILIFGVCLIPLLGLMKLGIDLIVGFMKH